MTYRPDQESADYKAGFEDGIESVKPEQEPVEDVVAYHSDGTRTVRIAPKRPWVGLTDDEISEIEDEYIVDYRIPAGSAWNFAQAIEAKLKEKNT